MFEQPAKGRLMETVTESNFQELVLDSRLPALITFCAPWCKACAIIEPIIEELAEEYQGKLRCLKADADADPGLASQCGVLSVPTAILYVKGKPTMRSVGFQSKKDIVEKIEKELGRESE